MVTCDPNELAPTNPQAMITILHSDDIDTWLRGTYEEVVALQRSYDAAAMTVRGPVFPTRGVPESSPDDRNSGQVDPFALGQAITARHSKGSSA